MEDEKKKLNMDDTTFNLRYVFKKHNFKDADNLAREIVGKLKEKDLLVPGWHLRKTVSTEMAKIIRMDYLLKSEKIKELAKTSKTFSDEVNKIYDDIVSSLKAM